MIDPRFEVRPIGWVESALADRVAAPRQADEGAPDAWLAFEPGVYDALRDLRAGEEVILLTWLDRAGRDVLRRREIAGARCCVDQRRLPESKGRMFVHEQDGAGDARS